MAMLLFVVGLLLFLTAGPSFAALDPGAVRYEVTNNALTTKGGQRFQSQVGKDFSVDVMRNASSFAWQIFRQSPADRKKVDQVLLSVDIMDGIAYTVGNAIHLGADYVGNVTGDIRAAVTEVYFHEVAHVWQWSGEGSAPVGLLDGIADYVVLKAGLGTWAKPGKGTRWDQGYDATALFLNYCSSFRGTFVADLNRMMKVKYSDQYFVALLRKTVDQLWADYKAKYPGGSV